jgi:hypothetical protein
MYTVVVVVFGMNEETSQDQLNQFRTILGERLGMESEQVSISDAFRLGRKQGGKTYPILVKLGDVKYKTDMYYDQVSSIERVEDIYQA